MTVIAIPMPSGDNCAHGLGSCCGTTCADMAGTRARMVRRPRDVSVRTHARPYRPVVGAMMRSLDRTAVRCGAPRAAPPSLAPI